MSVAPVPGIISFGPGVLYGTRNDISGVTPINFGQCQEVSINAKFTTKKLWGPNKWPIDIARGEGDLTIKCKTAVISGLAWANLMFGVTPSAGQQALQYLEAAAIPGTSPYTAQVTQHTTFVEDNGVVYAGTGLPFALVSSGPTVGQYSVDVSTGTYTFAAADEGKGVLITYVYSIASTGQTIEVDNDLQGITPTFSLRFMTKRNNKILNVNFPFCTSDDLTFQTKLSDYAIPEISLSAFAGADGKVMVASLSEVS